MNINEYFPHDLAGIAILVGSALSILKWIMRKEISDPLEDVKKSNEELAKAQRKSNDANIEQFDAIDKELDHHEVELTRHSEQIVTLLNRKDDK